MDGHYYITKMILLSYARQCGQGD